ncbi:MAG: GNAT family N-acetyltransferase [Flavobacteriaceae bacterium]
MGELKLKDNLENKRYEVQVGEEIARIEYIKAQNRIFLTHTEVPLTLEGKGIGSKMVAMALEDIERQNLTLVPMCPFVAGYIKDHPEWKKLILKGINIK